MEEESNPWVNSYGSPSSRGKDSDSDFLRPIKLEKKQEERHKQQPHPSQSSPNQSKQAPPQVDDFQCRPIRLGSRSTRKDDHIEPVTTPKKPSRRMSIQIKNLPIVDDSKRPTEKDNIVDDMVFAICVVDFHHVRGPEIEWWKSNYHSEYDPNLFKQLPFQALPDGSHLFEETFSNFNLVYDFTNCISIDDYNDVNKYDKDPRDLKTLFGCSCVRQIKTVDLSDEERKRNRDITRSIVQKAIVVITRKQPIFTKIKEKLSIIAQSFFLQETFNNFEVLENLFTNLNANFKLVDNELEIGDSVLHEEQKFLKEEEFFINLNLKNTILKFGPDFMAIFKCLLLEKKIIVFSNDNLEMLTQFQNNLISLIPNLINNLDNSGCPLIDYIETNGPLKKPSSLNTTNRKSLLRFFGLPLQIFNTKGSFWTPYLPLQQIEELRTLSFMVGCSNLLIVNQAKSFDIDLLVNLDTNEISYPNGRKDDLHLSYSDKKFINNLIDTIRDENSEFLGNDDHIRYQFEDYLSSLISTVRFHQYVQKFKLNPPGFENDHKMGNLNLFHTPFIDTWKHTENFKIWDEMADEFIFNFVDPQHLGANLADVSPNKLTSLLSNFKIRSPMAESPGIKAHKFIQDDVKPVQSDVEKENIDENADEETTEADILSPISKRISSWGWGFKSK